jgi:serine/threonine protein kinase/Tol biopolymer transport system component/Tfp pilus assembly protein PilF
VTPERWQHLKGLLHSVLARKPDERVAFLAEVCGDDEALREDLQSLLAHETQANSFIEQPAFGVMAETLTNEHATSMLGRTLGRYRIIAALGSGGMGEVYVAEDTQLGRKIALKILTAHFTIDDERVRRFQQEARAASALNHPNIITIYEIGQIDSRHFIVTEFVEGETLRQRMAKTPMVISEALDVGAQVASALATAHHAGIVHRDIKPENIMLRADGIAKVLDFGLAKLTEQKNLTSDSPTLFKTAPGVVMGTAHYMSPEQARGLPVDARTDIWSLGIVLFEMVGGRVPFEGTTSSDVIASILDREPTTLARYSPEAPTELEWIVKKALRKDREERYQTAKELLSDLKGLKRRLEFEQDLERSADSGPRSIYSRHVSAEADHAVSQSQRQSSREVVESLAILPLVNKCADPNMDYLSDGITESMINALSKLSQLRVMAWSTVSRYRGKETDPRDTGRELNVRAVLTGTLMQLGEQLAIKTELVDVMDGSHLWGESFRCQSAEILDIGAEISSEMSEKLLLRLTTEERRQLTKRYTDNVEAYHAYLRGRYCWNKRTDEGVRKAIEHFKQAIDNDPGYALAYCGLADSYLVLGSFGIATMSPRDAFPKARKATLRALEIDDTLAEAHASLAFSMTNYDWNWPAAEREFKRCFELKPGYATAHHWFGFTYLTAVGHLDQAIAEARQALKLDPLSLPVSANVGLLLYLARRYDEAIDQLQQTLELDQNFCYSHWQLALAYEQKHMYDEAIAGFQRAISLSGRSELPIALLGHAYAVSGRKSEALAVLDQLSQLPKQRYVSPYRIAAIHAGLQDKDRAFQWLERAFEDRDGWLIWLHLDPVMEGISSDRRFSDLLHRVVPTRSANSETTSPPRVVREPEIARERSAGAPAHSTMWRPWLATRHETIIVVLGLIAVLSAMAYLLLQRSNRSTKDVAAPKAVTFMQLTHQPGTEFFPSLSPDGKSFAYASRTSGNWDIYVQRVGGANPVNLTQNSLADDTQPAFSPAGDRIAFRSERDGRGIFLMGANGESVTQVSNFGYSPAWSPDGQQILVGTEKIPQPSTRPSKSQLWAINTRTNERRLITEGDALQPTWSPHGQRIAYWSRPSRAGQRESIWTIPASGGEAIAVTNGATTDLNPVWSPDGKYLFFSSNRGGSINIWRVAIDENSGGVMQQAEAVTTIGAVTSALHLSFSRDGRRLAYIAQEEIRNLRKVSFDPSAGKVALAPVSITRGSMQLWFPDVSPDGEWLTCQSMGNQRHIFIMRTDGSEVRDLTEDTFSHFWPRWSPDGKRIAFSSRRSGNYEIWSINRDGSGLQQLTRDHGSPGAHYSPWSPDGKHIAYSVHVPRNECILFEPDKAWNEQKLEYLPPLGDASISFEGWSWSPSGKKLAGIRHLPNGVHSGIGIYDLESKSYDWFTDFGDWPVWLNDDRRLLFVSEGKIFLFDTRTRKHQQILTVTDQDVDIGSPGLSPDNRTLYFTFVAAEADIWLMTLE